jgi:hypothetical protein
MELILRSVVLGDNSILEGIEYTIPSDGRVIQITIPVQHMQTIVCNNIRVLIKLRDHNDRICNIVMNDTNFPEHLTFLVFRETVHRFSGIKVNGKLIAQHGPLGIDIIG